MKELLFILMERKCTCCAKIVMKNLLNRNCDFCEKILIEKKADFFIKNKYLCKECVSEFRELLLDFKIKE